MPNSYPLDWIPGKSRTPVDKRLEPCDHNKVDFLSAKRQLTKQLQKLEAEEIVFSSNVKTHSNGLPSVDPNSVEDPGAVVYFKSFGKKYALGCDKWNRVANNFMAIAKYIHDLLCLAEFGIGSLEKSLEQFSLASLGEQNKKCVHFVWWRILGVSADASVKEINKAYDDLCLKHNPDQGGDGRMFHLVTDAYKAAFGEN